MKRATLFLILLFIASMTIKAHTCLQQYVASYKFPEGSILKEMSIVLENGKLKITSPIGNTTIQKIGDDQFSIPFFNGTAVFLRNEAKKIYSIKIIAMGITLEGTRVDGNPAIEAGKDYILPLKFPVPMLELDN